MAEDKKLQYPRYGAGWDEDELIVAYYYYCKLPFGRTYSTCKEVVDIANILGRSPGSVSRKIANFAANDPKMKERGIKGLSNSAKGDIAVAETFSNDWEGLVLRAKEIEARLLSKGQLETSLTEITDLPEGETKEREVATRINQDFFRSAVLGSYKKRCCMTGLEGEDLLIASHIKPWSVSDPKTERTNPGNGLCLNALHDRAFDRGLITVTPDYTIHVSSKLKKQSDNEGVRWILRCDKQHIILPERFVPVKDFLEYHNDVIFAP